MQWLDEAELCFPNLPNSSCRRSVRSPTVSLLIYMALSSLSLLTICLNMLVIISISHFKQLQTPTNSLLLSLAVSDLLVGFLLVFQVLQVDGCWYMGDLVCILYYMFDYVITSASVESVVLISMDCYVAVCDPFHYPIRVTQWRVCVCVSLCWLFSCLCVFVVMKENLRAGGHSSSCFGECVMVFDEVAGLVDILFFFISPVSIVIVLYIRVFVVAVSQIRAMRSHVSVPTGQGPAPVAVRKSELKSARTLVAVGVAFLICLCPYFCLTLTGTETQLSASSFAFVLFYVNSCVNPLIYALFYPWFRRSVRFIFTLQILDPGSSEAMVA